MTATSRTSSPAPLTQSDGPASDGRQKGEPDLSPKGRFPLSERSLASAPLRRLPAQQRSMARVQRMLTACAELLDEGGYAELTTTRIAERAGVAVGSIYQFFPDKKAVTQALGLRYLDVFSSRIANRVATGGFGHWGEAVDAIIDEYIDMHRQEPGFRSLRFGDPVDSRPLDTDNDTPGVVAVRLRDLLISAAGAADSAKLDLAAVVAVEAGDAVLKLAFRDNPDGDPHLISETKLLIRGYLQQVFGREQQEHPEKRQNRKHWQTAVK